MELQRDICHWCESEISRPSSNLLWIDDYESADCEIHPIALDHLTLERTGISAPHQTTEEVMCIIKLNWHTQQQQRNRQPLRAVSDNTVIVSKKPQRTSLKAAEKIMPKTGTIRRQVYDYILMNNGATDSELETRLGGKHQTISASRRSLVLDGYIVDSGKVEKNSSGNECIVWEIAMKETLFG